MSSVWFATIAVTDWERLSECVRITSHWVTLIGERCRCDKGNELEHRRVDKVDSVIVLPLQAGHIFCVAPTFRPGIGRAPLDLPGGQVPPDKAPQEVVRPLLRRERGIAPDVIPRAEPLNDAKWIINSAFSNQGLWAFVAEIDEAFPIPQAKVGAQGVDTRYHAARDPGTTGGRSGAVQERQLPSAPLPRLVPARRAGASWRA